MTTTQPINSDDLNIYRKDGKFLPVGYIFKNNSNDPRNSIEITGKIGQGGFAVTYKGEETYWIKNTCQVRTIAIKEFFPSLLSTPLCERDDGDGLSVKITRGQIKNFNEFLQGFNEEARILKANNGESIIKAYGDSFQENGTSYYIMSYIEGGSLYDYVKNSRQFSCFKDVWNFLKPLCEGLGKIKIIHCDISPHNILVNENKPILIDFGSCRAIPIDSDIANFSQTMTKQELYSPLEIACGKDTYKKLTRDECTGVTVSADIFSLGLIMYFMMAPEFFDEYDKKLKSNIENRELCRKIVENGFDFPENMDTKAMEVITTICKAKIGDRPQSMDDLIRICEDATKTEIVKSIANNTDINITPKIKINELASKGTLTITLPINDTSLNSDIIEGYSWRAFLKDNNLDPDSPDFKVGNLKFKRISINAEKIDHSRNYKLFAQ